LLALRSAAGAQSLSAADNLRGALLYPARCDGCRTELMHWRDKKFVKDWVSRRLEIRHWQSVGKVRWN
jgi:hypothetical protein